MEIVGHSVLMDQFHEIYHNLPHITTITCSATPPWISKAVCLDTDLLPFSNRNKIGSSGVIPIIHEHLQSKYRSWLQIFTDGSVSSEGAGASVICQSNNYSQGFHLPLAILPYTAELLAIEAAVDYVLSLNSTQEVVILSDCLQAITDIANSCSILRPMLLLRARSKINKLTIPLTLCYIPGHVGFRENELADQVAKLAVHSNVANMGDPVGVEQFECKAIISKFFKLKWDRLIPITPTGKLYRSTIKSNITSLNLVPRLKESTIYRLRVQHCRLNSYLFKIGIVDSPLCSCNNGIETVFHFLFECPTTVNLKAQLVSLLNSQNLPLTIDNCLNNLGCIDFIYAFLIDNKIQL